jgi:hypothetical protein
MKFNTHGNFIDINATIFTIEILNTHVINHLGGGPVIKA